MSNSVGGPLFVTVILNIDTIDISHLVEFKVRFPILWKITSTGKFSIFFRLANISLFLFIFFLVKKFHFCGWHCFNISSGIYGKTASAISLLGSIQIHSKMLCGAIESVFVRSFVKVTCPFSPSHFRCIQSIAM